MPPSTIATPQMERVRQLCDQAKNTPEGLIIWFRVDKYGDLASCKSAARSMQTSFCNLRVRSQRLAMRLSGETTEYLASTIKGEYGDIACVVRPIPNDGGYTVRFSPAYSLDMDLEVTDAATGKPFESEDPQMNRFLVLNGKMLKEEAEARRQRRAYVNPLTYEEHKFLWDYDAQACRDMNIPPLPTREAVEPDYSSIDLADLPEDELEIVNPSPIE